jgi:nitrogen regulatory protein PII
MKLIRCTAQQPQLDDILDALEAFEILSLMVATGGERSRSGSGRQFYRGAEYKIRLTPTSIVDVTVPDYEADEVVRVLEEIGGTSAHPEFGRILVLTVDECHRVRARRVPESGGQQSLDDAKDFLRWADLQ